MAVKKVKTTKLDIIKCAAEFFFEHGYSATSPRMISEALDLSTGNITYYFPSKEHLLAVFVEMLCDYQWKMMEEEAQDGVSSVLAVCLELTTMAAVCEEDPIAKEFYLSSYSSPLCLDIIRRNDAERNKKVFKDYCPDWTDEQFAEAEILVSGIEYATLMTGGDPVALETRISGALNHILRVYNVPEEIRARKLRKVFALDYRSISRRMMRRFEEYIKETNEQALELAQQKKGAVQ
ncbi:MAG: TetR/AcrR family transcriptional regulator [Clostridia bacterium]|nr:TetR/AcrR family transcriptional regulator [Clostridia bacterium]